MKRNKYFIVRQQCFLQASVAHTFDMFAIDIIDFIAIIVKTTADVGCLYRQTSFIDDTDQSSDLKVVGR